MKTKAFIIAIMILLSGHFCDVRAQKVSLSTNLIDWANFGTANIEAGLSMSQHFSLMAGAQYNPWEFKTPKGYGPWYVYSGWWIGAKAQYSHSGRTGIWRPALEEKRSVGGGLSFGYTVMLHEHINLELGAGLWGGRHLGYTLYECPECMKVRDTGARYFIAPDDVSVSIMFVF